jgi:gliding motility-associated-like protein
MRKFLLFVTFFSIISFNSFCQTDTAFWFAAPDISSGQGDQPVWLRFLSYNSPATVTVWQPANGSFTPVTLNLPANASDSLNLTPFLAGIENDLANTVLTRGLRIHSTAPIGAVYELKNGSNREFFSLKGQKGLGTDFYTPFQKFWANGITTPQSFSSVEIVATENATTVLITPRTNIIGHVANTTYSITLNAGETYCARDTNATAASSLSGSIISANKPVAVTVFTGAVSESGCLSTMGDQLTSSAEAGTDFIVHRGSGNNERVYILATQNNTNLDIYGSTVNNSVINWSETQEHVLGADTVTYIKASKPVYVMHVSGFGCKMSAAQVPNLYCAGTYSTAFTRTSADSFALRLYIRSGFEGSFTVNGASGLINASDFRAVPGTSGTFLSALIYFDTTQVPVDSYQLVENPSDIFGLGIMQGSSSAGSSFAYLSEFISYPFVNAGADDTICANTNLNLNGYVGGGSVTGTWSGTGFGTFQNGLTALSNVYIPSPLDTAISPIQIILSSTGPCPVRKDTITIEVTPSPILSASADQIVCANNSNIQLAGSVTGGSSSGVWSTLGDGSFSPSQTALNATYQAGNSDTASGAVALVLTSTNFGNCNAVSDTMIVTITNSPYAEAGPTSIAVCANNADISLSGIISGPTSTGKWTSSGTGIFSPNNINLNTTYIPDPNEIFSGNVTLYLSSTNNSGCLPAKDSIVVTFTQAPQVIAGSNGLVCNNNAVIPLGGMVAGPTSTGIWGGVSGTFSPNDSDLNAIYIPSAAEIASGSVVITLTSTNNGNCNAISDGVNWSFIQPPFANFSATNVCIGDSNAFNDFSLQGFGNIYAWSWDFGDGNGSNDQGPYHSYSAPGTYSIQLIVESTTGCFDTVVKTATVFPKPNADFNFTSVCSGTQITVNFNDLSTIAFPDTLTTWLWDYGGAGGSTQQNPSQVFIGTGNYAISLTVATNNGCTDTVQYALNIPTRPSAGFYYNTTNGFSVGAVVNFIDSSSNAVFYQWDFGDLSATTSSTSPTHTYFSNGSFLITEIVSDSLGCSDTAKATIIISNVSTEITTLIPNAISPNGDGKNDFWKLSFINILYPDAIVEVYNKWGQKVFSDNEGYVVPWDGTYKGEQLPAGSYFYIINLNSPGEPTPYTGSILLVR